MPIPETLPKAGIAERNHSLDVLRTLAMLLVILLHVAAPYASDGLEDRAFGTGFWAGNVLNSFARVSVPVFVLISGSFLLGRREAYATFYLNRASRILWPFVFWVGAYSLYALYCSYALTGRWAVAPVAVKALTGKPFYHLWYLYMLLGLYLVTPVISRAIAGLALREVSMAACFLLLCGFTINLWNFYVGSGFIVLLWFTEYLGYYLMGYVLARSVAKYSQVLLLLVYVLLSLLTALFVYATRSMYFYEFLSPLVLVASLALFKMFSQLRFGPNLLARLAKLTLGIYVVHAGVLEAFQRLGQKYALSTGTALLDIPLRFCLVLLVSVLLVQAVSRVPGLKRVV